MNIHDTQKEESADNYNVKTSNKTSQNLCTNVDKSVDNFNENISITSPKLNNENTQKVSNKSAKSLKEWEREKRLIPIMIRTFCRGKHKRERKLEKVAKEGVCSSCEELTNYALFRLEKCPFKVNKKFCSFCKIHCYSPEMKQKIKLVMKYSGPRMLFTHPIYAFSHVVQMIKYKKEQKKTNLQKENKL